MRLKDSDLSTLCVEIAHQITRDINHPHAPLIVSLIEDIILNPNIVRSELANLIACELFWIHWISEIDDLDIAGCRSWIPTLPCQRIELLAVVRTSPFPREPLTLYAFVPSN